MKLYALVVVNLLLWATQPAQAQLGDLLKQLGATAAGVVKQSDAAASAGLPGIPVMGTGKAKSLADIDAELAPDRQCNRPQEKFDIGDKVLEYGGTEASLRLQRIVESDLKYEELTPEDRKMLRYLAQTTVWVPVWLENRLGSSFDLLGNKLPDLLPVEQETFEEVRQQSNKFRALTSDFPGDINLSLNPELPDGAFAKFGGRIQISRNLLQTMSDKPLGGDLLLAHEIAHVYKRHAIKRMQFELISSREGWGLGKKLLQRAQRGSNFEPLRDGLALATTVPQLIAFVRNLQLHFSSEQELEADACAALWLKASALDPAKAWLEFRSAFAPTDAPQAYASTHPPTAEREENFIRKVNSKPGPVEAKPVGPVKTKPPPKKI